MLTVLRSPVTRVVVLAIVLVALGLTLVDQWSTVSDALAALSAAGIAVSLAAALVALVAAAQCWRVVLADYGSALPVRVAGQIYFAGQLGKFIPGGVWPILFQIELAADHGVPRRRTGVASLVQMAVLCATGAGVGCVALLFLPDVRDAHGWWLVPVAIASVVAIVPPVLNRIVAIGMRVLRRPPDEHRFSGRGVGVAVAWSLVTWAAYGVHIGALVADLGAEGDGLVAASLGGYALAWVGGFLVVFTPAGAGVREALLVLVLGTVLPTGEALTVALVSRLLVTVADAIAGLLAVASAGRQRIGRLRAQRPQPVDAD